MVIASPQSFTERCWIRVKSSLKLGVAFVRTPTSRMTAVFSKEDLKPQFYQAVFENLHIFDQWHFDATWFQSASQSKIHDSKAMKFESFGSDIRVSLETSVAQSPTFAEFFISFLEILQLSAL